MHECRGFVQGCTQIVERRRRVNDQEGWPGTAPERFTRPLPGPRPAGVIAVLDVQNGSPAVLSNSLRRVLIKPGCEKQKSPAKGASLFLARPERFELPTAWFVARYSIQLSYGRTLKLFLLSLPERLLGTSCASPLWGSSRVALVVQNRSRRFCRTPDHSIASLRD